MIQDSYVGIVGIVGGGKNHRRPAYMARRKVSTTARIISWKKRELIAGVTGRGAKTTTQLITKAKCAFHALSQLKI